MSRDRFLANKAAENRQELINYFHRPEGLNTVLELMHLLGTEITREQYTTANAIQRRMAEDLEEAELFISTDELTDLLSEMAPSYPAMVMHPSDIFTPTGLIYFAEPITVANAKVRAVGWSTTDMSEHPSYGKDSYVMCVIPYIDACSHSNIPPRRPRLYPVSSVLWRVGRVDGGHAELATNMSDFTVPCVKLLLTFWAILRERLTIAETIRTKVPTKLRKVAAKNQIQMPAEGVRIIRLRRSPQISAMPSSGQRTVERHHSWVVRGFWRNQYYPSTNEHKPKLILSHFRGPRDKPLLGKDRIFLPPKPIDGNDA